MTRMISIVVSLAACAYHPVEAPSHAIATPAEQAESPASVEMTEIPESPGTPGTTEFWPNTGVQAIVDEALAITRELSAILVDNRGQCGAMAIALERFADDNRERLQSHLQRAMSVSAKERAEILRVRLAGDPDLTAALDALAPCERDPRVMATLRRLRMM